MKLNIDIDTSRNVLSINMHGLKNEDYSKVATEVLERAIEFVKHLPEHIPEDDPKCDEYGNVLTTH